MTVKVNGRAQLTDINRGQWLTVSRQWQPRDTVEITIPLRFRRVPIDEQHPDRVAIMRGPVVYAQEDPHKWLSQIPAADDDLDRLMKPLADNPGIFQIDNEPVVQQRNAFKPFYSFVELERYRMYFDSKYRRVLWQAGGYARIGLVFRAERLYNHSNPVHFPRPLISHLDSVLGI